MEQIRADSPHFLHGLPAQSGERRGSIGSRREFMKVRDLWEKQLSLKSRV